MESQYRYKAVSRSSYLYDGNPHTCKDSLYMESEPKIQGHSDVIASSVDLSRLSKRKKYAHLVAACGANEEDHTGTKQINHLIVKRTLIINIRKWMHSKVAYKSEDW